MIFDALTDTAKIILFMLVVQIATALLVVALGVFDEKE